MNTNVRLKQTQSRDIIQFPLKCSWNFLFITFFSKWILKNSGKFL